MSNSQSFAKLDRIVTICLMAAGLAITVGGVRLKIGAMSAPEPGFFPFVSGAAIVVFSLVQLASKSAEERMDNLVDTGLRGWLTAAALAGALAVYTATLDWLGYLVATTMLSILVMRIAQPQGWLSTIAIAAAATAASFYLFNNLLGVTLPAGELFN